MNLTATCLRLCSRFPLPFGSEFGRRRSFHGAGQQQQQPLAASVRAAARFRHGGDHPAPAHVPLVHVGHLSGCVCFSLRADTR